MSRYGPVGDHRGIPRREPARAGVGLRRDRERGLRDGSRSSETRREEGEKAAGETRPRCRDGGDRPGVGNGGSPLPGMENGRAPRRRLRNRVRPPTPVPGPHRAAPAAAPAVRPHGRARGSGVWGRPDRGAGSAPSSPVPGSGAPLLPVPPRCLAAGQNRSRSPVPGSGLQRSRLSGSPRYPSLELQSARFPLARVSRGSAPLSRLGRDQAHPRGSPHSRRSSALSQPGPSGALRDSHFRFHTIPPLLL